MRRQLCILIIVLLTAWEWPVRICGTVPAVPLQEAAMTLFLKCLTGLKSMRYKTAIIHFFRDSFTGVTGICSSAVTRKTGRTPFSPRAVSGGPVYVSDRVGETNPGFIRPLITETGLVIRCREVGMPTTDCLFDNPADTLRPLKIFNRYGENYVIGAFHICEKDDICLGKLEMSDIPGTFGTKLAGVRLSSGNCMQTGRVRNQFFTPGRRGRTVFAHSG